jgi:alkylhydroperoxidase/carboxymuconolactone decarboxylase family protein YurZ
MKELVEVITHLAFLSDWPNSMSAIMAAKEPVSKGDSSS